MEVLALSYAALPDDASTMDVTGICTSGIVATTGGLCGANAFEYLTELQRHAAYIGCSPDG